MAAGKPSSANRSASSVTGRRPGSQKAQLARDFGISREIVYQYLRAPATPT